MAGSAKRGSGDRVLESRHLVGLFLGVVLLCAVFFTLGYVMGKTQYDSAVHAASNKPVTPAASTQSSSSRTGAHRATKPTSTDGEWDIYAKKSQNHLEPATKPSSRSPSSAARSKNETRRGPSPRQKLVHRIARLRTSKKARSRIVLQVAALTHRGDAFTMANALRKKGFPSFVAIPTSDRFYRVQVGPYRSEHAAESARRALETAGFRSIVKR